MTTTTGFGNCVVVKMGGAAKRDPRATVSLPTHFIPYFQRSDVRSNNVGLSRSSRLPRGGRRATRLNFSENRV